MNKRVLIFSLFFFELLLFAATRVFYAQSNPKDRGVPTWNPKNNRIYFKAGGQGKGDVYSVNKNGKDLKPFIVGEGEDYAPRWTHDGKRGVFMAERNGDYEIYSIDVDGKNEKRLTFNKGNDWDPSWSPDGKKIVFMSGKDGNWEIYTMNADGSNQTRLTNNNARDFSPAWSPDGKKILFSSDRDGDADVHIMNADGSNQVNISHKPEFDNAPEWSPDGRKIVYARRETKDDKFEIYVMNADGSNLVRLTNNAFSDIYPIFSPDGKKIVFQSDRDGYRDLYMMNADGSGEKRLIEQKAGSFIRQATAGFLHKKPIRFSAKTISVIFLSLLSAANIFAQAGASEIIENSLQAVGGRKEIAKVRSLRAFADCTGPNGNYTTEIYSAKGRRLIFKQTRGTNVYTGQTNGQTHWTKDEKTNDFSLSDERTAGVWRSHDFQFLAMEIGERFKDFVLADEEIVGGKTALKLNATDETDNPAAVFFDKNTLLLLGFTIQNPFDKQETIRVVFNEWRQTGKLKLPSRVTATDNKGDFVLNFREVVLNKTDEKIFAIPAQVAAMREISAFLKQARAAHFTRNAKLLVSTFADDFSSIANGKIQKPSREASITRFQNYFNNSTFIEWDDITPPVIKVSDDASMAFALVHKKVRLLAKTENGKEEERTEIFAWAEIYRKIKGEWKLIAVVSTNTPEKDG